MKTGACTYRPEIDGLRAIAVLSVVAYHAGFSNIRGGFVGVDIFFVISGYLITRLLLAEMNNTGRIDFLGFYLRRARRLLPALFFTLILTTIVAFVVFTPQRFESYGGSLLHAVLTVSNGYFFSETGYFDTDTSLKPLLHTWSLGVEEQFYFIWPIIIVLFGMRKWLALAGFMIIGLVSLFLAQIFIHTHAGAVFFLMPFRAFEFAVGAILVWMPDYRLQKKLLINILFVIGLGCIAFSLRYYHKDMLFPGLSACLPCLGAALVIYASEHAFGGKLFKTKALVWVGLISYSFYLIHWPIIVFYKYHMHREYFVFRESVVLFSLSMLVASFMYYFIEQPFRLQKKLPEKFLLTVSAVALCTAYVGASIWATGGWPWRYWLTNHLSTVEINRAKEARFQIRRVQCRKKGRDKCDALVKDHVNALIMGDSHALDALNALNKIFPSHNFGLSTLGGCPPHHDIEKLTSPTHPDLAQCKILNKQRYDVNYLKQYDYIVLNVLFSWYTVEHLREYLVFLKKNGIEKVIVMGGYFSLKEELPELLNKLDFVSSEINNFIIDSAIGDNNLKTYTEELGYLFLSKKDAFHRNGDYEFFDKNKVPFTYDQHHLSYEFAARIAVGKKEYVKKFLDIKNPKLEAKWAQ